MQQLEQTWWRLVSFGFRLLYNEMAITYDLVSKAVSLGQWRCWQRTVFNFLPDAATLDAPILEVAHGTGDLQLDLHERGYHSIGYDLSPHMGRIAQGKLRADGITPILTRGMAQHLPFADATFPAAVSTFPTSFIVEEPALREIYRVLQPDGVYVVVVNGVLTGGDAVQNFLEWLYTITGQREEQPLDYDGVFADVGFRIEIETVECPNSTAQLVIFRK